MKVGRVISEKYGLRTISLSILLSGRRFSEDKPHRNTTDSKIQNDVW